MPTEPQRNSNGVHALDASNAGHPPLNHRAGGTEIENTLEEFISLRDIIAMILRHRRAVSLFVLLTTLAAGFFFFTRPRQYQAEGYLQIIPHASQQNRVDELFETTIASHLQKASSAYIAKNVSTRLSKRGVQITPLALEKHVKITRPPKTDLIRLTTARSSADEALLIVQQWVCEYLESIQKNNIYVALSQSHQLLKQAQAEMVEKQAKVNAIRAQFAQSSPLITLSRAVDDRQLWGELTQKTELEVETLKKLSTIHIKGQEQNKEYINLKLAMLETEQTLASALARRNLYQEVVRILENKVALNGSYKPDMTPLGESASEATIFVNTIMRGSDIIQFGEAGLISANRGALKSTGLFFLAVLGVACLGAFIYEWGKGLLAPR